MALSFLQEFHIIFNHVLLYLFCIFHHNDPNLLNTRSSNPHFKTPIPEKPSKLGFMRVWHKNYLYLDTSTIGNGNPHPTNINSRMRSIKMTPRSQLFFDKSFREPRKGDCPTSTQQVWQIRSFINLNCLTLHVWLYLYLY